MRLLPPHDSRVVALYMATKQPSHTTRRCDSAQEGFCQLPVPVKPFKTNDDVFPLLPDILCAYWDPLLAQQKAAGVSRNEEPVSSFQAVNASIYAILQQYEQLTGNALIMDSNLAANALPISISVPEPVPRSELVRIIESALLLNNYALIPSQRP